MNEGGMELIKVRAVKNGQYGLAPHLRRFIAKGEIFEVMKKDFSDFHRVGFVKDEDGKFLLNDRGRKVALYPGWMERLDADGKVVLPAGATAPRSTASISVSDFIPSKKSEEPLVVLDKEGSQA